MQPPAERKAAEARFKERVKAAFDSSRQKKSVTPKVKELYDSLSDEQKRTHAMGIYGIDDELWNETSLKLQPPKTT